MRAPAPVPAKPASLAVRLGVALALAALAVVVTDLLVVAMGRPFFFAAFPAVAAAAILGGTAAGALAAAVCVLSFAYRYFEPVGSIGVWNPEDVARAVGFFLSALLVAWMGGALRAAVRRAERERAAAEDVASRLRRSEALHRTLSEAVPGIVWVFSPDGKLELANRRWHEYTGITVDELNARGWESFTHPGDHARVREVSAAHADGSEYALDFRYRGKDGLYRWFTARAVAIRGADERPVRWVATMTDIDARRRTEEALQDTAARLAALQSLTARLSAAHRPPDVAAAVFEEGLPLVGARAGSILAMSDAAELELLFDHGFPDDVRRKFARVPLVTPLPTTDAARTASPVWLRDRAEIVARYPALAEAAERWGAGAWACVPLVANGRCGGVFGLAFATPQAFEAGDRAFVVALAGVVAQALDRARLFDSEGAARHRAEAAEHEARRMTETQEEIMAVLGHDLRNPLGAIQMTVELLRRGGALPPAAGGALDRIARSTARMAAMIQDLLDAARARRGIGITLDRRPVRIDELCRRVVEEVAAAHPGRAVVFVPGAAATVDGDPSRLAQVVSNLVVNGIQHGAEGAAVTVTLEPSGGGVALTVHNDGPPVPSDVLPTLFEPFRRGSAPQERSGLGLGLYIVREIVRAHGGRIDAASSAAAGTTIRVELPALAGALAASA